MAEIAVCLPTRNRPDRVARCLRALAGQTVDNARFRVIVGVDAPDAAAHVPDDAVPDGLAPEVVPGPSAGPAATRNRILRLVDEPVVLWLNDDVVPDSHLIEHHLAAHASGERAMVLGSAPWVVREPDRLFDRLIRETSMVFFYDQMDDDPARDWGYRHAWTLNLSVPAELATLGFCERLPGAAYEDLEWAWRAARSSGAPVRYRPAARVEHDHRYEPEGYLARERAMGRDAFALAAHAPEFARELFRRDVRSAESLAYARAFVEREAPLAERLERSFRTLADLPAGAVDDDRVIAMLYEHHLALKRWHWNAGLVEAADGAGVQAA
ncbi:MAG: glycosyltransferase [Phycisphaerales bacterium]